MASRVQLMKTKGLISPPKWIPPNMQYEVITGSVSYGASSDTSDMDIVGWVIPPKEMIFPHLAGHINGFGPAPENFEVYQQHHVMDKEASQEYDFTVYSIVKFFDLVMGMNPNAADILFTPQRCVLHCTRIAQLVRDNRKMFLHKGAMQKFRGYSYSQLGKIGSKANASNPKRQKSIIEHGYDVKFAYNVVRLLLECEQILIEGDLDIERNSEILKSVRRGEWTLDQIKEWFGKKEPILEELYAKSTLPAIPNVDGIKNLLMKCLEEHYGDLSDAVKIETPTAKLVKEMQAVLDRYS